MWFDESYFNAISLDTLDAIGTALKPVAPISGFIFFLVNKLKILTAKIPPKTDKTKASYWSCRLPRYAKLLGLKSSFSGFW